MRHRVWTTFGIVATSLIAGCGATSGPASHLSVTQSPTGSTTTVTLAVEPSGGGPVNASSLAEVRSLLEMRAEANGIPDTSVSTDTDAIRITAPSSYASQLRELATVPHLRFRQVFQVGPYEAADQRQESGRDPAQAASPHLTPALRNAFDRWNCHRNPNPTGGLDRPDDYIIACDLPSAAALKYLLAPSGTDGSEVQNAFAGLTTNGVGWVVNVKFTSRGAADWLALTKTTYEATNSGESGFDDSCEPPAGCNAVSIVLGGVVYSAPAIESPGGIPGGLAQITGNFSRQDATSLAVVIKLGSLPVRLRLENPASGD